MSNTETATSGNLAQQLVKNGSSVSFMLSAREAIWATMWFKVVASLKIQAALQAIQENVWGILPVGEVEVIPNSQTPVVQDEKFRLEA